MHKGCYVRILGIYDDHNCGCAVVENGKILAAIEEERLSRIKFHNGTTQDGPPRRSLAKVLEMTRSNRSNIDSIALAIAKPADLQRYVLNDLFKVQRESKWIFHSIFSKSIRWDRYFLFYAYWFNWNRIQKVKKLLREFDLDGLPIQQVDHHTAHAASAYYTSGRDEAFIVTLDGQGDGLGGSIFHGIQGRMINRVQVSSFNSIGLFYNFITWMLGFKPNRHEGKITGLAAYGDPQKVKDIYEKLFHMDGPNFQYDLAKRVFHHAYPHRSNYPKFLEATWGCLNAHTPEDISAGVQDVTEKSVCQFVRHHLNRKPFQGKSVDVCMAGGVFANVKVNQRVAEIETVDSVYIFPSMGDGGLSVGAALWCYYQNTKTKWGDPAGNRLKDAYLGPSYTEKEIKSCLDKNGLKYKHETNIEDKIGALLAKGKVVARFDGRMEFGPRALGNRSILYQTTDPSVNDWLNKKLKRTEFMPFAPVSLYEDTRNLYNNVGNNHFPAEYMTITFDCTEKMQKSCPATVHVDNTARPQLIRKEINESYYNILKAYQKRTGLSTIINTSYNMHEEPIVCSPEDAVRAFQLGHLEYLAIGSFLVESPKS